ncbi:HhH-GPD family protein [Halosimplex halophilum]|uniref:hypothetical protein n=1 Tax=Halosimplex halophilum TaxID=2559572 RepID=UPI00107F9E4D|nr:hypothetical protein [Halosimplex halophilum]
MVDPLFPFGRTQVTSEELRDHVDEHAALDVLQEVGVDSAGEKVDEFLTTLPQLLSWLETYGREYPWRYATDPWRIYATEILLQRTRADAVEEIYEEFFSTFSRPGAVLEKSETELRECIRSLGFVNHRVRSIQEAAELCVVNHDGAVPTDLEALQQPWRVGPYTARACMLFAFQEPLALVDANTARITGRVFEYPLPDQPHKSEVVYRFLDSLVPADGAMARAFNLALLDLGALRCTHAHPICEECPLNSGCTYSSV